MDNNQFILLHSYVTGLPMVIDIGSVIWVRATLSGNFTEIKIRESYDRTETYAVNESVEQIYALLTGGSTAKADIKEATTPKSDPEDKTRFVAYRSDTGVSIIRYIEIWNWHVACRYVRGYGPTESEAFDNLLRNETAFKKAETAFKKADAGK